MKKITLGNSLFQISEISLGMMSIKTIKQAQPIVDRTIELGVNYFDTADLYDKGKNEQILGEALKGKRQDVLIATKVGNRWRADGSGWDWKPHKKYIIAAVEESLIRLQTDYVDLYQLHGGTIDDPLEEVVEAFEMLKKQGKIRAYGISSIRPNTIRKWLDLAPSAVSCMLQYSLLDRRSEEFTLNFLKTKQQSVLVRGALAKGLLANKKAKAYLNFTAKEIAQRQQDIAKQAKLNATSSEALAMKFILTHPVVSSIVLGVSNEKQLDVIEQVMNLEMNAEQRQDLSNLFPASVYQNHR